MKAKKLLTIGLPVALATTGFASASIALVSCSNNDSDKQTFTITMENKSSTPTFGGSNDIVVTATFPTEMGVKEGQFKWQYKDTDGSFKDLPMSENITSVLNKNVCTLTIKSTAIDQAGVITFSVVSTDPKIAFEKNTIDVTVSNATIAETSFASTNALQLDNFIKIGTETSSLSGLTKTNITTSNTGTTTLTVTASGTGIDSTKNYIQVDLSKITTSVFTASTLPEGSTFSFALANGQDTNWKIEGTTVTSKALVGSSTNTLKVLMTITAPNYDNLVQEITFTFSN